MSRTIVVSGYVPIVFPVARNSTGILYLCLKLDRINWSQRILGFLYGSVSPQPDCVRPKLCRHMKSRGGGVTPRHLLLQGGEVYHFTLMLFTGTIK